MSDMKEGRWCPDECPITGHRFFMWLEHPELGYVPTYGGPFDSYTLATLDEDGLLRSERYDHDEGSWVEGGHPMRAREGLMLEVELDPHDEGIQPTPESERAAFNGMMRWHLIRLLQAWRYGGDLRAAGMAAFEWARTNDVGQDAFKASERAVKLAAPTPTVAADAVAIDSAAFAKLQTFLTEYHADVRPSRSAGLAAWALAALVFERADAVAPSDADYDDPVVVVRATLVPKAAQPDERAAFDMPAPGFIASAKTIAAVSAALDAVREYANDRVADQMNRAVNMLLDELGQARAASQASVKGDEQSAPIYAYEWDCGPGVVHRDFEFCSYNGRHPDRTLALYARAAAPQAGAGEPVAYVRSSYLESLKDPRIAGKGCFLNKEPRDEFVPLYAVPTDAQQPARELTDEQIEKIFMKLAYGRTWDSLTIPFMIAFAHALLAAQGGSDEPA